MTHPKNISLLRSLPNYFEAIVYKHFVPAGLRPSSTKLFCYHGQEQHTNGALLRRTPFLTFNSMVAVIETTRESVFPGIGRRRFCGVAGRISLRLEHGRTIAAGSRPAH